MNNQPYRVRPRRMPQTIRSSSSQIPQEIIDAEVDPLRHRIEDLEHRLDIIERDIQYLLQR